MKVVNGMVGPGSLERQAFAEVAELVDAAGRREKVRMRKGLFRRRGSARLSSNDENVTHWLINAGSKPALCTLGRLEMGL